MDCEEKSRDYKMEIKSEVKTMSISLGDRIVITKIQNPVTGKESFLVKNEVQDDVWAQRNVFITDDIIIDGIKYVVS
jgi:hypothetical protein